MSGKTARSKTPTPQPKSAVRTGRIRKRAPMPKPLPPAAATPSDYLTRVEVAKFMRVDLQVVDYNIRNRGLRAVRFGRRVLVKRSWLDEYLLAHEVKL
jgi:excisionase family DNA binding protein